MVLGEKVNMVDLTTITTINNLLVTHLNNEITQALIDFPSANDLENVLIENFSMEYIDPNMIEENTVMVFFDDCQNREDVALLRNNAQVKIITGIRGSNLQEKSMYIHAVIEYILRSNRIAGYEFFVNGRDYYVPARPGDTEVKVAETILKVQREVHLS